MSVSTVPGSQSTVRVLSFSITLSLHMPRMTRRSAVGLAATALPALAAADAAGHERDTGLAAAEPAASRMAQSMRRPTVVNGRRYLHYDVFTDRPLTGNQLAVFLETTGLTAAEMQAMTRETRFSECTFVQPAEQPDTDIRLRIFGPANEMQFAGHPVIGSTFALADEGVIRAGQQTFTFGLGIGPTLVELEWQGRSPAVRVDDAAETGVRPHARCAGSPVGCARPGRDRRCVRVSCRRK